MTAHVRQRLPYHPTMVRHAAIIACFLALGAILNIAAAWACAAFIDPSQATVQFNATQRSTGRHDAVSVLRRFGHTRIDRATLSILELDPETQGIRSAGMTGDGASHSESLAGWPMRTLMATNNAEVTIRAGGGTSIGFARPRTGAVLDGLELSPFLPGARGTGGWRALPLRPLWPGVIFNTLFYAALLWLLILGPFGLRRARRRKRGLCIACAYPIGVSPICTECGAAVTPRTPSPPLAS